MTHTVDDTIKRAAVTEFHACVDYTNPHKMRALGLSNATELDSLRAENERFRQDFVAVLSQRDLSLYDCERAEAALKAERESRDADAIYAESQQDIINADTQRIAKLETALATATELLRECEPAIRVHCAGDARMTQDLVQRINAIAQKEE